MTVRLRDYPEKINTYEAALFNPSSLKNRRRNQKGSILLTTRTSYNNTFIHNSDRPGVLAEACLGKQLDIMPGWASINGSTLGGQ